MLQPGYDTLGDSMNPARNCPANTLKCCLLNAKSVVNKLLDVQVFAHSQTVIDVLAVTDTFLSDATFDGELVGCSYSVFRRDGDRHGGGNAHH